MHRNSKQASKRRVEEPEDSGNAELLIKIQRIVTATVAPLVERLAELERTSATVSDVGSAPSTLIENESYVPRYLKTFVMAPPVKPRFSGREHPVLFLEELKKYMERMELKVDDIGVIMECLTGHAKNWSSLFVENWKNIMDFERDFLVQFWGREVQNRIKRKLSYGRWTAGSNQTMSEYFAELFNEAKGIASYSSKEAIADDIMTHFPTEIRRLWTTHNGTGAIEAIRFLKSMEDVMEGTSRVQYTHHGRNNNNRAAAAIETVGDERGWEENGATRPRKIEWKHSASPHGWNMDQGN